MPRWTKKQTKCRRHVVIWTEWVSRYQNKPLYLAMTLTVWRWQSLTLSFLDRLLPHTDKYFNGEHVISSQTKMVKWLVIDCRVPLMLPMTCSLCCACGMLMSRYDVQGCSSSFIPSCYSVAVQVVALCKTCLNIKSLRTTVTLDSSIIILNLLHKSKRGGKALAGCLKLLTELMCQLQFFAVVTRSKKSKNQARRAVFFFWSGLSHSYFTDAYLKTW